MAANIGYKTSASNTNNLDNTRNAKYKNKEESIPIPKVIGTDYTYKHEIVWKNAIGFLILHIFAVWGGYLILTGNMKWQTSIWMFFMGFVITEGITIGAHRFYTHKAFKATPFLRAVLLILHTGAGQNCLFVWCRDHRLHHRYTDTDGDPHNSKRGFFFCHMGWLMCKKHPYVIELGRKIDMSDLEADWMVMFQKKYFYVLYLLVAVIFPVWVPVHFFGEDLWTSFFICYSFLYVIALHCTWFVNSIAHLYGTRPYDRNLQPVESRFVSMLTMGEGWHNYHHAFPWDYKAAELNMHTNPSAAVIRFLERMGLAYDLKSATQDMVDNRIKRTGDGSHYNLGTEEAQAAVTVAWGPLHPLNPTYNTTLKAPDVILKPEGLPLFHEKDVLNHNATQRSTSAA